MLLTYLHCFGVQSKYPELCLIADKPDQFSCPIRICTLRPTIAAVCRSGPGECFTVDVDPEDNNLVITPMAPAHIFITPDIATMPGVSVKKIKPIPIEDDDYVVYYIPENDRGEGWIQWIPNREKRSATKLV